MDINEHSRTLLVMRHGEASWDAAEDRNRQLTSRGELQAEIAADLLLHGQWRPDLILVSPYVRTRQTAGPITDALGTAAVISQELTPDTPVEQLIKYVDSQKFENLLIVSHQPLVSTFIAHICGDEVSKFPMDTASMAMLDFSVLSRGCGSLRALYHSGNYGAPFSDV